MANATQVQAHGPQHDQAQAREANANHSDKWRWYGPALMIFAVVVGLAVVAVTQYRSEETTVAVSHVGDHANMVHMGHFLFPEWNIYGLNSLLSYEVQIRGSVPFGCSWWVEMLRELEDIGLYIGPTVYVYTNPWQA